MSFRRTALQAGLTCPSSLMANAARKMRDSGEKKIVARDIRKVTMVRKKTPDFRNYTDTYASRPSANSEDERE
jgi:hypothetical protein